jgi:hypothetical protein
MKSSFILILSIIFQTTLLSQTRFARIIDFGQKPQNANEILSYGDQYFLSYSGVFVDHDQELFEIGSGVLLVDSDINIYDSILVRRFSTGIKSLLLDSIKDKIYLCGEKYIKEGYPHEFTNQEIDISNLELESSYDLKFEDDNQINYFQVVSESMRPNIYVAGSSRHMVDESIKTLIFKVKDNKVDTSIIVDLGRGTLPWYSILNRDNHFVLSYMVSEIAKNHVHIIEYDNSLNEIWHWTSENIKKEQLPYFCELENGSLMVTLNDPVFFQTAALRCIGEDLSTIWQFRFSDNSSKKKRKINKLIRSKNGDVIGLGTYGNLGLNKVTRILEVPYIFRLSSTGQLLWEKAFYRERPVLDYCNGSLRDLAEMDNGDIIAVGRLDNYLEYDPVVMQGRSDPDIFIVRMDAYGCIDDRCEMLTKVFPDSTSNAQNPEPIYTEALLYPNPSDGNMELLNNDAVSSVNFFSSQGVIIKTIHNPGKDNEVPDAPSGMYIAQILLKSGKMVKQKIVVH